MTNLRLYNTLTRAKEDFVPLDPKNVRMYVCGPTVYDYAHIGNARPAIVFDVLFRLLKHLYPGAGSASDGSRVTYVRNVTDIDDKINARALERRGDRDVPILDVVRELTQETYGVYQQDMAALGNLSPTFMPRATENVPQMIAMIEALIAAGHAYEASGHVLFDVLSKPDYGKLSRRPLDEMIAGARIDVAPYKKNPMDFVLWKPSDASTPGWDSPWGRGRPGWHLECSAMIEATFKGGDTIDIHGGGIDLVFPHHENEIAQSEGAHHEHSLARFWMHNGFLNVEGDKMSKSLGNFVAINELLKDWDGEVLRFNMLRSHYRQPMDWTLAGLHESQSIIDRWIRAFEGDSTNYFSHAPTSRAKGRFWDALFDDLNTPLAITELHKLADQARRFRGDETNNAVPRFRNALFGLGLRSVLDPRPKAAGNAPIEQVKKIDGLISKRNLARRMKNFGESDRIRDELAAQGIALKDNPDGTTSWEVKR